MEDKQGKFIQGAWIDDKQDSEKVHGKEPKGTPIDQRIDQVSGMVNTSFHQVLALARDLISTPEGHAHIERQIQQASSQIENALSEILKSGEKKENGDTNPKKKRKIRIE